MLQEQWRLPFDIFPQEPHPALVTAGGGGDWMGESKEGEGEDVQVVTDLIWHYSLVPRMFAFGIFATNSLV